MNGMYISKTADHYRPTPKKTTEPDTNAKDVEKADSQFKKYLSGNPTMKNIVERPGYKKGTFGTKAKHKFAKVMREGFGGTLHSGSKKGPVVTNPAQMKAIAASESGTSRQEERKGTTRVMPAPTGIAFHAKKR
jgi:hypothetical protein